MLAVTPHQRPATMISRSSKWRPRVKEDRVRNRFGMRVIGVLLLVLVLGTLGLGQAQAATLHPTKRNTALSGKTLFLDHHVVVRGLPSPSLSDLKKKGFTLVGTQVKASWGSTEYDSWPDVTAWIGSVHSAGLKAFGLVGIEGIDAATMATVVKKAVSSGVDVVVLDELIARYSFTQAQLQSIMDAGLSVKSTLQFIVVEYETAQMQQAYVWTANYPTAMIASDNYWDLTAIDYGANLAVQYGKTHLVWIIFSQGTSDFPCYTNLESWLQYVKQKGLPALFWNVDEAGTWQANWSTVAAY